MNKTAWIGIVSLLILVTAAYAAYHYLVQPESGTMMHDQTEGTGTMMGTAPATASDTMMATTTDTMMHASSSDTMMHP